jgi:hypothetical protein
MNKTSAVSFVFRVSDVLILDNVLKIIFYHILCPFGIFYGHLVYFMAIWSFFAVVWSIFPRFQMLCQVKSGSQNRKITWRQFRRGQWRDHRFRQERAVAIRVVVAAVIEVALVVAAAAVVVVVDSRRTLPAARDARNGRRCPCQKNGAKISETNQA